MAQAQVTFVAGSYERFLFGYQHDLGNKQDTGLQRGLQRAFTYPAHQGPVKCVSTGGAFVASGGADDQIHLYDIQASRDLGFLVNPGEGAVTAIALHTPTTTAVPSHLFSGSADGSIAIWQANSSWDCLKVMHAHRKEVTGLAVHCSGRLALSVGRDESMRVWNLVKGRCSYTSRLAESAEHIAFTPSGTHFALTQGITATVRAIEETEGSGTVLKHARRVTCLAVPRDQLLLAGCEGGLLALWDLRQGSESPAITLKRAHKTRLRGLAVPETASGISGGAGGLRLVGSASSDGVLRLWDLRMAGSAAEAGRLAEASTGARLTCLCAFAPTAVAPPAVSGTAVVEQTKKRRKARARAAADQPAPAAPVAGRQEQPGLRRQAGVADTAVAPNRRQKAAPEAAAAAIKLKPAAKASAAAQKRKAARQAAVADDGVVVHDGVVEFPDSEAKSGGKKKQKKQKQQKPG